MKNKIIFLILFVMLFALIPNVDAACDGTTKYTASSAVCWKDDGAIIYPCKSFGLSCLGLQSTFWKSGDGCNGIGAFDRDDADEYKDMVDMGERKGFYKTIMLYTYYDIGEGDNKYRVEVEAPAIMKNVKENDPSCIKKADCVTGPCCNSRAKYVKTGKSCGNRDCNYLDTYFDDGADSPTGTNKCILRDYETYCNKKCTGKSADCPECGCDKYEDNIVATCGVCQYCAGSGCANYADGTACDGGSCFSGVCLKKEISVEGEGERIDTTELREDTLKLCGQITDIDLKNLCYITYATELLDIRVCEMISNLKQRNVCQEKTTLLSK